MVPTVTGRARKEDSPHLAQSVRLRNALRGAREQHGISQQELASRAGVAIGTVRAVETGRVVEPGFFTVLALADALALDAVAASGRAPEPSAPLVEAAGTGAPRQN